MMMSQLPSRWNGDSPPSPVSIQQPASAAPRDRARTAGSEIAPKLIPLMLTTDRAENGTLQYPSPILLEHGIRMVDEQDRTGLVGVVGRAEADHASLGLGEPVDPAARGAVERQLLPVVHEEVLPEILALLLEEITQVPDDREIAEDGVLLLRDVLDEDEHDERDQREGDQRTQAVRQETHHAGHR